MVDTHAARCMAELLQQGTTLSQYAVAGMLLETADKVDALKAQLESLEPGITDPLSPATCRALSRFWAKVAENLEAAPSTAQH